MRSPPDTPLVEDAPDSLRREGHLWIQELVEGGCLRFQVRESGAIRFGDRSRTFPPDEAPLPSRHAVRHIRTNLDRNVLREALPSVESAVFFGVSTQRQSIEYDWERLPPFLGVDVWSAERERFLPPDSVDRIFDRVGLHPINTVAREVRARDFDPGPDEVPASEWYDGPAAGVVLRNKSGGRAKYPTPRLPKVDPDPIDASPTELADEFAPRERFEAVAARLEEQGRPVSFDAVRDRVLEGVFREEHRRLLHGQSDVDVGAFEREIAERTSRFLADRTA